MTIDVGTPHKRSRGDKEGDQGWVCRSTVVQLMAGAGAAAEPLHVCPESDLSALSLRLRGQQAHSIH